VKPSAKHFGFVTKSTEIDCKIHASLYTPCELDVKVRSNLFAAAVTQLIAELFE
jgi:hypothetical protein